MNWSTAEKHLSSRKFLQTRSSGSLPVSQYKYTTQCFLYSLCDTTADCQQTVFLFGSICFASVDFPDLQPTNTADAYVHSGIMFPTSNPLSMVCDNVCTISYYTNTCNSSNNSKKQDSSKFVQLTYKCCLLCRICKVGKLSQQLKAHHKLPMNQSRCESTKKKSLSQNQDRDYT